jgi:hypothetical protein
MARTNLQNEWTNNVATQMRSRGHRAVSGSSYRRPRRSLLHGKASRHKSAPPSPSMSGKRQGSGCWLPRSEVISKHAVQHTAGRTEVDAKARAQRGVCFFGFVRR